MTNLSLLRALRDRSARGLNVVLAVSVAVVVFVGAFSEREPLYRGAHSVGTVAFDVSISYIAGWIIWYLVTWRTRTADRDTATSYAMRAATELARSATGIVVDLWMSVPDRIAVPLSRADVSHLCSQFALSSPIRGSGRTGVSVEAYLSKRRSEATRLAAEIDRWHGLLDLELLRRTYAMVDSPLWWILGDKPFGVDVSLGAFSGFLVHYLELERELASWVIANGGSSSGFSESPYRIRVDPSIP